MVGWEIPLTGNGLGLRPKGESSSDVFESMIGGGGSFRDGPIEVFE
jgi:hypothetical protein